MSYKVQDEKIELSNQMPEVVVEHQSAHSSHGTRNYDYLVLTVIALTTALSLGR